MGILCRKNPATGQREMLPYVVGTVVGRNDGIKWDMRVGSGWGLGRVVCRIFPVLGSHIPQ